MNTNCITKATLLIAAISAGAVLSVQAQFSGSTSGIFDHPVAGADNPDSFTTGIGTSSMTWGDADGFGTGPNALTFTGNPSFSTPAETPFSVGTLDYFNGTVAEGTDLDSVGLNIKVNFTVPSLGVESFDFPLTITTTVNTSDPVASADYITLPPASSTTFTVGPETYTLDLSFGDFSGDGFLEDGAFHVYEGESATAPVNGVLTTNLNGVTAPDSASTMLLLGGVSGLLCWMRRK